jgi:hypothetical protein
MEDIAIGAVVISDQILRRCIPWKGFGNLPRKPFRCRIGCNADPILFPAAKPSDKVFGRHA